MRTTQCLRCHRAAHVCLDCVADERDRLRAEVETLKRERDEAVARVLDVAQLAGISYEADGVASAPGPHEVILETLREWKHARNLKFDWDALIAERDRYRKALEDIVDRATIETAPAANIARKALEGEER